MPGEIRMFTGIVEELGEVTELIPREGTWRLSVRAERVLDGTEVGSSVAVNGACLTVAGREGSGLTFEVGPETLKATALGDLVPGAVVNLERPVRLGAPLGGHLVLGHVDGVGRVSHAQPERDTVRMRVEVPDPDLERYLIPKGSVAIDGVSLTVAALDAGAFEVMLIPHTLEVTTLGRRSVGDRVNLEMDLVGKYLYRYVATSMPAEPMSPRGDA